MNKLVRNPCGFKGKSEVREGTQIPYCNHLSCVVKSIFRFPKLTVSQLGWWRKKMAGNIS